LQDKIMLNADDSIRLVEQRRQGPMDFDLSLL
jgi:hypothetical protein